MASPSQRQKVQRIYRRLKRASDKKQLYRKLLTAYKEEALTAKLALTAKEEALTAKEEALTANKEALTANKELIKVLERETKRTTAERLRAIHQLSARGVMEQLEVHLGKHRGDEREGFWATALANASNTDLMEDLAACAGMAPTRVSKAYQSSKKLKKLCLELAKSLVNLYAWLSEGIHNASGNDSAVPVRRSAGHYSCQIKALCKKYGVDTEDLD